MRKQVDKGTQKEDTDKTMSRERKHMNKEQADEKLRKKQHTKNK